MEIIFQYSLRNGEFYTCRESDETNLANFALSNVIGSSEAIYYWGYGVERRIKLIILIDGPDLMQVCISHVLSKEDFETLNLSRSMMERGECPLLMVVFDHAEGYTVEADKSIKDLTVIREYVGDIDFLKNREYDDGDRIMTLLSASNPSQSLVVFPDKRSNIAPFITGIDNHTPEGNKKQNMKCVRFNIGGECRAL